MVKIPSPELLRTLTSCKDCHLCETASHPFVPGRFVNPEITDTDNIQLVLVGEACGRVEDEVGACFQNTSLKNLEKALGDTLNECYLTNVCKCVPWLDVIRRDKVRKPSPEEMKCCLPWLLLELAKFREGTTIVAMGATAFSALMPEIKDPKITELAGKEFDLVVHDKHYKLIAQVHPASISYNPSLSDKFFGVFNRILESLNKKTIEEDKENWQILTPSEAVQKMNETKQLYLDRVIKYVVTDTETSGFTPWRDRIIMFGLSHTADKKGYSIPIEIQNRVDFPDFPVKIYPIDFEISNHDVQLIKKASRELFSIVPIVGHNIKFDLKMLAYHNFLLLDDISVYNDTMLMSSILIGRGWRGDSIGLKEMCVKLLGLEQGWDWIIDEWLARYKRVVDRTFANIPTCILGKYCALDHYYTRELHEFLYPKIEEHNCKYILDMFNIATKAYSEAELKGIDIDWDIYDMVKEKSDSLLDDIVKRIKRDPHIKKIMKEKYLHDLEENSKKKKPKDKSFFDEKLENGDYFSIASVKDKKELLYNRYGIKVTERTDKGEPSCSKEAIGKILSETKNERLQILCSALLEFNKFAKLKTTYIDNLPDQCDQNRVFHCEFNLAGTVTGRLCIHGDTIINTLNGDIRVADLEKGQRFYVYSYDLESHRITFCEAIALGMTRKERKSIEITLDNGEKIITTVDHKYLTRDEEYVEAQNLKIGDSLMPLYRRENKGYLEYYDNQGKWNFVHRDVAKKFIYSEFGEAWKRIKENKQPDSHVVVHHKDFNKKNNDPSNLTYLGEHEHWILHANTSYDYYLGPYTREHSEELARKSSDRLNEKWKSEEFKEKMYEVLRENNRKNWENPEYRKKVRESNNCSAFTDPEIRKIALAKSAETRKDPNWKMPEESSKRISEGGKRWWSDPENKKRVTLTKINKAINKLKENNYPCGNYKEYNQSRKEAIENNIINCSYPTCKSDSQFNEALVHNHQVVNIRLIEYEEDVCFYDITVPECHNFVVNNSVVITNSSGFHVMPKRSEIKRLYASKDYKNSGSIWLSPDMSQLELRVTAGIANESSWIEAYKHGEDLHQRTAANMFNIPFEEVTKDQRKVGKCVTGDTLIETDKGKIQIDKIVPNDSPNDEIVHYSGDLNILTLDGYRPITDIYRMENAEICEVETEEGQIVRGTHHHEFVVGFSDDGTPIFKKAVDLVPGDEIYLLEERN